MSPAEQLRAAAARVRTMASEVEYGTPWAVADDVPDLVVSADVRPYGAPAVAHTEEGVAAWIALMSPAVAEPLAAWLEHEAAQLTRDGFDRPDGSREELDFHEGNACLPGCNRSPEWTGDSRCDHFDAPLAVARVILGEAP